LYIFFHGKIIFRGKFRGIFWKNDFSELFFAENSIFFPTFLEGKFSAEFSPKFLPEKMYEKSAPCHTANTAFLPGSRPEVSRPLFGRPRTPLRHPASVSKSDVRRIEKEKEKKTKKLIFLSEC
jgi:hypothetical protein